MRSIRITKVDYSPLEYEYDQGKTKDLEVILTGTERNGEFAKVILKGTRPRFWVPIDPVKEGTFERVLREKIKEFMVTNAESFDCVPNLSVGMLDNLEINRMLIESLGIEIITKRQKGEEGFTNLQAEMLLGYIQNYLSIDEIVGGYKSATTGEPLWCIFVKYPWNVKYLRTYFDIHYQADVNYSEAVRFYYQIGDYITIPDDMDIITPDQIRTYTGKSKFPIRDYNYDIEVGETADGKFGDPETNATGPILCYTYMENRMGKPGGKIYHGTMVKVDENVIRKCLSDPKWLAENCDINTEKLLGKSIEPIKPEDIEIRCFYESNPLVAEYNLLKWEQELISQICPTHIVAYNAPYDHQYRLNRPKAGNNYVKVGTGAKKLPYLDLGKHAQVFDIQEAYKLSQENLPESSSLEFVAGFELGYGKIRKTNIEDMRRNDPNRLSVYNIWDAVLLNRLERKMHLISNAQEKADFHNTDISNYNSAMKLVESMLMFILKKEDEILPSIECVQKLVGNKEISGGGDVMGAPIILERNMFELDNTAEYPMIIISCNIDHRTLIPDSVTDEELIRKKIRFSKLPSIDNEPPRRYYLDKKGILPEVLKKLKAMRDTYKDKMAITKKKRDQFKPDTPEYNALDDQYRTEYNLQFKAKTAMNSFFGVCGTAHIARPFRMAHPGIGSDITNIGRLHNQWNRKMIEQKEIENHKFKVLYQDSVGKDSEIMIFRNDFIEFCTIESLFKRVNFTSDEGKEYYFAPDDVEQIITINDDGKAVVRPIKNIMRHKCSKKMYRVHLTNQWYVDVTEDHSLIGYIGTMKKAKVSCVGERFVEMKADEIGKIASSLVIAKNLPPRAYISYNFPKEMYELFGLFISNGSFAFKGDKNYYVNLSCGNDLDELLEKVIIPLQNHFEFNYCISKSRKGDITMFGLDLVKIFNEHLYNIKENKKKIPKFMYHERFENICAFIRGAFSGDGTIMIRGNGCIVRFTNIDWDMINGLRKLLYLAGVSNSVIQENQPNKYKGKVSGTYSKHITVKSLDNFKERIDFIQKRKSDRLILNYSKKQAAVEDYDFDLSKVQSIEEIEYDDYVYDIEVEQYHRFFANGILVHNTDSSKVVTTPQLKTEEEINKISKMLAEYVNSTFDDFAEQTFGTRSHVLSTKVDSIYKTYFQWGVKKRYAYLDFNDKIETRGVETRRSSATKITKHILTDLFKEILISGDFRTKEIKNILTKYITDIRSGKYDRDCGQSLNVNSENNKFGMRAIQYSNQYLKKNFFVGGGKVVIYKVLAVKDKPVPEHGTVALEWRDNPKDFGIIIDYAESIEAFIEKPVMNILTAFGFSFSQLVSGLSTGKIKEGNF